MALRRSMSPRVMTVDDAGDFKVSTSPRVAVTSTVSSIRNGDLFAGGGDSCCVCAATDVAVWASAVPAMETAASAAKRCRTRPVQPARPCIPPPHVEAATYVGAAGGTEPISANGRPGETSGHPEPITEATVGHGVSRTAGTADSGVRRLVLVVTSRTRITDAVWTP